MKVIYGVRRQDGFVSCVVFQSRESAEKACKDREQYGETWTVIPMIVRK